MSHGGTRHAPKTYPQGIASNAKIRKDDEVQNEIRQLNFAMWFDQRNV